MIDFTMPVTRRRFRRRGSKVGSKARPEPQQKRIVMKTSCALVRAPGESYSDVILRRASDAKP